MTKPESARSISSVITNPLMRKATQIAFGQCGNCLNRVRCSSRIIDVPHLLRMITDETPSKPAEPSLQARTAAKLFKTKCGQCDQLEICIHTWTIFNHCESYLLPASKKLRELYNEDEEVIAGVFEGYLRALGLTGPVVMGKAARLWWKCDKDKSYQTLTTLCIDKVRQNARR